MNQTAITNSNKLTSFQFITNNLTEILKNSMRIKAYIFATLIAIFAGSLLEISVIEWVAVLLTLSLGIVLILVHSILESTTFIISMSKFKRIHQIKELTEVGVLISASTTLIISFVVFYPKIVQFI